MSVNKAILIGNLGSDPEVRYTASGTPVASFSIATNEKWTDKSSGEKKEKVEWHRIVAWGRLGEICGEYLSKGRQVYIEGRIQTRSWDDRDGNKRYTTEIVAQSMTMLGGRGDSKPQSNYNEEGRDFNAEGENFSQVQDGPRGPEDDDDIPF